MILLSFPIIYSIFGAIIGALLTVVTAVFAILMVIKGAYRNFALLLVGFIACLALIIISITNAVTRAKEKTSSYLNKINSDTTQYNALDSLTKTMKVDTSKMQRVRRMEEFRALVNDKYANQIPADFYLDESYYKDTATKTFPFIFPYFFHYNGYGYELMNAIESQPIQSTDGIEKLAYDKNMLLIKFERTRKCIFAGNEPEVGYMKIDLKTGKEEQYLNVKKLFDEAGKAGYTGDRELKTFYEIYSPWYGNEEEGD